MECLRNVSVLPEELYPIPTTLEEKNQVTAFEAIADLEKIECIENAKYNDCKISNYIKGLKSIYKNFKKLTNISENI